MEIDLRDPKALAAVLAFFGATQWSEIISLAGGVTKDELAEVVEQIDIDSVEIDVDNMQDRMDRLCAFISRRHSSDGREACKE